MVRRSEAYARGAQIYDEFIDSGKDFTTCEVKEALRRGLASFQEEAFTALVDRVFDRIDNDRDNHKDDQLELFDTGGVYKLGDGRRIGKRFARLDHALEALAIDDQNKARVVRANNRKRKEVELLRPYWGDGVTKEEAIAAFEASQKKAVTVPADNDEVGFRPKKAK